MMTAVAVKEQRKRDLTAIALALLIHLLVVGAYFLSEWLFIEDVIDYSGPVLVKLGRSDAPEEEVEALPASPTETVETPEATAEETPEAVEERESGTPEETVKPQESESEEAVERPVSQDDSGDAGEAEASTEESSGQSGKEQVEAPPAEVEVPVTVSKGDEAGNAYETTFEAAQGVVGRSLGVPIYYYLPLPISIDQSVLDNLQDDPQLERRTAERKRGILSRFYESDSNGYILMEDKQPPLDYRPELWAILSEGGYDINIYKSEELGLKGRQVVFTFVVEVGSGNTELSNVKFLRRTGYYEIDQAVIYGFQQAVFSNSSETPVKGRFTYRFQ